MPLAINKSEDELANCIARAIRATVQPDGNNYVFHLRRGTTERTIALDRAKLTATLQELGTRDLHEETALISDTTYEIMVK